MKKVLALGAGVMGTIAAATIASFDEVASLIIADLDLEVAKQKAVLCGDKAQAAPIDVTNRQELVSLTHLRQQEKNSIAITIG